MQRFADAWLTALHLVDLTCRLLTVCGAPAMKHLRPDAPDNRKCHQLHDGEDTVNSAPHASILSGALVCQQSQKLQELLRPPCLNTAPCIVTCWDVVGAW